MMQPLMRAPLGWTALFIYVHVNNPLCILKTSIRPCLFLLSSNSIPIYTKRPEGNPISILRASWRTHARTFVCVQPCTQPLFVVNRYR